MRSYLALSVTKQITNILSRGLDPLEDSGARLKTTWMKLSFHLTKFEKNIML